MLQIYFLCFLVCRLKLILQIFKNLVLCLFKSGQFMLHIIDQILAELILCPVIIKNLSNGDPCKCRHAFINFHK